MSPIRKMRNKFCSNEKVIGKMTSSNQELNKIDKQNESRSRKVSQPEFNKDSNYLSSPGG